MKFSRTMILLVLVLAMAMPVAGLAHARQNTTIRYMLWDNNQLPA
jgi:hypothetical protein